MCMCVSCARACVYVCVCVRVCERALLCLSALCSLARCPFRLMPSSFVAGRRGTHCLCCAAKSSVATLEIYMCVCMCVCCVVFVCVYTCIRPAMKDSSFAHCFLVHSHVRPAHDITECNFMPLLFDLVTHMHTHTHAHTHTTHT